MSSEDTEAKFNPKNFGLGGSDTPPKDLGTVYNAQALKECVLKTISDMPENGRTHKYMLYILRALESTEIISDDLTFLNSQDANLRKQRENKQRFKTYVITLTGLALSIGLTIFGSWLISRFPR